eukprot:10924712-Alexandrium_andersonii.AAC.1
MSASLVGSEMCIRDRSWDASAAPSITSRSTPATSPGTSTCSAAPVRPWTVSYTHLTLPTICSV